MQHSEHLLITRDLPELPSGKRGFLAGLLRSPVRKQIDAALKNYAQARASYTKLSEQNNKVSSAYDAASITDDPAKAREPYLELRTRLDAALTTAEKAFDSVSDAITARDANRRGAGVDRSLDAKVDAARGAMQAARQQFTAGQAVIDPPPRRQPERTVPARTGRSVRADLSIATERSITNIDATRGDAQPEAQTSLPPPPRRPAPVASRFSIGSSEDGHSPPMNSEERAVRRDTFGTGAPPVPRTHEISSVTKHNTFPHRNSLDISKLPRRRADSPPRPDSPGPSPKSRGIRR